MSTGSKGLIERILARDQIVVAASVAAIVLIAGLYTVWGVGMNMSALEMTRMARPVGEPMQMAMQPVWSLRYAALIFLMWWIMMIAMMTPSASPMILLYTALKRQGPNKSRAVQLSLFLLFGYLAAWAGFSVLAALMQWGTEAIGVTSGAIMALNSKFVAGGVLLAAGLYQFSSLKEACLEHCRSPAHFLSKNNRSGSLGALRTGAIHGAYCLGCCWALMALLFVGGIMNLYWIVGIALYVLVEKLAPWPQVFSRLTGLVLMVSGSWFVVTGLMA